MADERTCYAGDLGTDQLGKTVRVETVSGAVVTDGLCDIRHWLPPLRDAEMGPRTWVRFKNVQPAENELAFRSPFSNGFEISPTALVTVLP